MVMEGALSCNRGRVEGRLLNDSLADEDSFGVFAAPAYSLGRMLMDTELEAPFVLGIYGPWGTGKSTFMRLLKKQITDENSGGAAHCIHFMPWQFENKDDIFNALMLSVLTELEEWQQSFDGQVDQVAGAALSTIKGMVKKLAFIAVDAKIKSWSGGHASFEDFVEAYEGRAVDRTKFINQFQAQFSDAVGKIFKARGEEGGRLFIFIDDLDRCTPENAITVLETMKLFFDANHCFFIVGIDKEVVQRGIEVKYDRHEMIRGQDYLDKLIQLPFTLPRIPAASLEKFASDCLDGHRFGTVAPRILAIAAEYNPRRLKRLLNCVMLIGNVVEGEGAEAVFTDRERGETLRLDPQKLMLLLALQVRFPTIHGLVTAAVEAGHGLLVRDQQHELSKMTKRMEKREKGGVEDVQLADEWFASIDRYRAKGAAAEIPMSMKQLLVSGEHLIGRSAAIDNLSGYLRLLQAIRETVGDIWFDNEQDLSAHIRASGILQTDHIDFKATVNRANQIIEDRQASGLPPTEAEAQAQHAEDSEPEDEDDAPVGGDKRDEKKDRDDATEDGESELPASLMRQAEKLSSDVDRIYEEWRTILWALRRGFWQPRSNQRTQVVSVVLAAEIARDAIDKAIGQDPRLNERLVRARVRAQRMTAEHMLDAALVPRLLWPGWFVSVLPLLAWGALQLYRYILKIPEAGGDNFSLSVQAGFMAAAGLFMMLWLLLSRRLRFKACWRQDFPDAMSGMARPISAPPDGSSD